MDSENKNIPAEGKEKGQSFLHWLGKNIILAVIFVIGLALVASLLLGVVTHHGQEIEVPDLNNMSISEAEYTAGMAGLRVEVTDSVYIRRMGRGLVYSQNPKAGEKVKKGRRIILTINSISPKKVNMPDLVGLSMRQARAELASKGLTLGKLIYVEDIATNNVIRQLIGNYEVKPGMKVVSGSSVDLVVGLNPDDNMTVVPSVIGMKYLRAVDGLQDNSLNLGKVVFDKTVKTYSDSLDAVVYKQSPASSSEPVLMGSQVTIYLSKDSVVK
jgi:beta-lactam-binding protein with PASTA domain